MGQLHHALKTKEICRGIAAVHLGEQRIVIAGEQKMFLELLYLPQGRIFFAQTIRQDATIPRKQEHSIAALPPFPRCRSAKAATVNRKQKHSAQLIQQAEKAASSASFDSGTAHRPDLCRPPGSGKAFRNFFCCSTDASKGVCCFQITLSKIFIACLKRLILPSFSCSYHREVLPRRERKFYLPIRW